MWAVERQIGSGRGAVMNKTNRPRLKRSPQLMPGFVREALEERQLMAAYKSRPSYQQNDYLGWINRARHEETKRRRLSQRLEELEGGTRYMKMRWSPPRRARRPV